MGAKLKFQRKLSKELTRICGTIIFSFAFLLINCLDKIIHFSFLRYHARHLFVLARRLPQKNVYMFLDIRPLRFEAKEQAGIKMGAGPFESGPYPQRPQAFIRFL